MIRRQFKADIGRWPRQVCFVPRSGSCTASEQQLFDHSVSCGKQRRRDGQTKCLGRLKIAMSALPPKADMCSATRNVRFVPIADMKTDLLV